MHYYTEDHEWIDFQGSVAYVGICDYKLKGLRTIEGIAFCDVTSAIIRDEVLATVLSDDYRIPVHMPVDGRVVEINKSLLLTPERILDKDFNCWIAKIQPLAPYSRDGLLLAKQYQLQQKRTKFK